MDVLIGLAGQTALLLWAQHMVTSGVQRERSAAGSSALFASGSAIAVRCITALIQSSTATAMMGWCRHGRWRGRTKAGARAMPGANVGTTLIVLLVSFDPSLLSPTLILIGVLAYCARSGQVLRASDRLCSVSGSC